MKQFILATAFATPATAAALPNPLVRNTLYLLKDSTNKYLQLIWGKGVDGVPSNIILDKVHLSYEKTTYRAGVPGVYTIPLANVDFDNGHEAVVEIFKLGAVFNERNVFSTSVHKTATANTAALIAAELAKQLNLVQDKTGVLASASGTNVVVTVKDARYPVKVVALDGSYDATGGYKEEKIAVTETTANVIPIADTNWVKDLAHQCIGDRGVGYTEIAGSDLFTPIDSEINAASYNIYTVTSYAPRYDHRKDEPLYHKVHIAVPTSVSASTLEGVLTSIVEDKIAAASE